MRKIIQIIEHTLLCISGICLTLNLYGQHGKKIFMYREPGWLNGFPYQIEQMERADSTSQFTIPKFVKYPYLIKEYDLNYGQYLYKKSKNSLAKLTPIQLKILNRTDTSILKSRKLQSVISVLVYEDSTKRYFILDKNINANFCDDKVFSFNKSELFNVEKQKWKNYLIRDKMNIEYLDKDSIIIGNPYVTIYPFKPKSLNIRFPDELEQKLFISGISWDILYKGFLSDSVTIFFKLSWPKSKFNSKDGFFYFGKKNDISSRPFRIGDYFEINDVKYKLDTLYQEGKNVVVKIFPQNIKEKGYYKHFYINSITTTLIGQKEDFLLYPMGKPMLLDFWGTWCKPCKVLTPEIVALEKKYKRKIDFISIADDDSLGKVQKYITENRMTWKQIQEPLNNNTKITIRGRYSVSSFPTFILIDTDGKVLFRESGIDGFDKLKEYLLAHRSFF